MHVSIVLTKEALEAITGLQEPSVQARRLHLHYGIHNPRRADSRFLSPTPLLPESQDPAAAETRTRAALYTSGAERKKAASAANSCLSIG